MIKDLKLQKQERLNTCVYMDYENIEKQLSKYNTTAKKINFFDRITKYLETLNLNVIDFIVYANYDDSLFNKTHQTWLQSLGLQTRHTSNKGKNSGDLEMTIDALKSLYKNDYIDVFVIISCDRDFIPLIKAIKSENKITYVISTEIGFNKVVTTYADAHEYIENIFKEELDKVELTEIHDVSKMVASGVAKEDDDKNVKRICSFFYKSRMYKYYKEDHVKEIILKKYLSQVSKAMKMNIKEVDRFFRLASSMKYICIYDNNSGEECIKEGIKKDELTLD